MNTRSSRPALSALALAILVPAASIGTLAGLAWGPGTWWGWLTYAACKVIIFGVPITWYLVIDLPQKLHTGNTTVAAAATRRRYYPAAIITGVIIFAIILATGLLLRHGGHLDPGALRALAVKNKIAGPLAFIGFALFTTFFNALLEEFVWRWFVTRRWEEILPRRSLAFAPLGLPLVPATLSALCFTAHHIIVLALYFPPGITALASTGVFLGALIWSLLFIRSRSVVPGYISHILADAAVFTLGWMWIVG